MAERMNGMRLRMGIAATAVALAGALTAGCASRSAEQAALAQTVLVGMPVATLLSCAGVPDRRQAVDNVEVFTYENLLPVDDEDDDVQIGIGGGAGLGSGGSRFGLGLGLGLPAADRRPDGCIADVTVRDGRVAQLGYRREADTPRQCYALLENCLALVPATAP